MTSPVKGGGQVVRNPERLQHLGQPDERVDRRDIETVQLSPFLEGREQPRVGVAGSIVFSRSLLGSGFRHISSEHCVWGFIFNQFNMSLVDTANGPGQVTALAQAMNTSSLHIANSAMSWSANGTPAKVLRFHRLDRASNAHRFRID